MTCEEVARRIIGTPARKVGHELVWPCPNHDDKHPSLSINPAKDVFLCGPCGKGGNAWRLAAWLGNIDPNDKRAVVLWLKERGLISDNSRGQRKNPFASEPKKEKQTGEWRTVKTFLYTDSLRKIRLERDTVDTDTGQAGREKSFRWQHLAGDEWKPGDGGNAKPLYTNGDFRSREQPALVLGFEGEAKADLAGELGFAAFSFKHLTAEQCSLLADCDVVLWPDRDKPGLDQARDACRVMAETEQCKTIRVIRPPEDLPIGGDIMDAVRDQKYSKEKINALIFAAEVKSAGPVPVGIILATVKEKKISWLWDQRIPFGSITVLDGDPGMGKSLLTIEIAARLSKGAPLAGAMEQPITGGTVILTAEDSIEHVVVARLRVACADLNRIVSLPFTPEFEGQPCFSRLPNDLPTLAKAIRRVGAKLVVFDVFSAYLAQNLSIKDDQDVRRAIAPLSEIADRTGCAVVLLRHLTKAPTQSPILRGGGSIGIVGAARSNLLLAKDPSDSSMRILAIVKSNFGGQADAVRFRIMGNEGVAYIEWSGFSKHTPESLLSTPLDSDAKSNLETAMDFLRQELTDGQKRTTVLVREARKLGISERTLDRAKAKQGGLGVLSRKVGDAWFWELPD